MTSPSLLAACIFLVPPALAASTLADAQSDGPAVFAHAAMGTEFQFTIYGSPESLGDIAAEAFDLVDDLESRISSWRDDSQTTYINNNAGIRPVRVSEDLYLLALYSRQFYRLTGGAFDVTVGPLVDAWGFRESGSTPVAPANLQDLLPLVGMDKTYISAKGRTVYLQKRGMKLDFGAIGKGLALDQVAWLLARRGIVAARLSAGTSTILTIGMPPGQSGWKVHIAHPYNPEEPIHTVILRDAALSTSVCRTWKDDRDGPCDILDPRTGMPARGILSATVIGEYATETDALSTAFLVMGAQETEQYCRNFPNVRAILVVDSDAGPPVAERFNFVE